MHFPIYHNDYQLRLEEVYRYLKCFRHHIVYLQRYPHRNDHSNADVESTHHYLSDGLVIRLAWKSARPERFHPGYLSMEQLMKRHKNREFSLLGYRITEYSQASSQTAVLPDAQTKKKFHGYVLQNRAPEMYTPRKYHNLEYNCRVPSELPDFLFDWVVTENQNKIDFESYYETWKKRGLNRMHELP